MSKITKEEFILDCLNAQFSLTNKDIKFESWEDYLSYKWKNPDWNHRFYFNNKKQFADFQAYYFNHYIDYKSKKTPKKTIEAEFCWFLDEYGFNTRWDV